MNEDMIPFNQALQAENYKTELSACNAMTQRFELTLSPSDISELASAHEKALEDTGRFEFGGGILKKLIYAFCDSPYISPENYVETLLELQDSFYYYKSESGDALTDDELIEYMKMFFDGPAQGSLDYMENTSLGELCRAVRNGVKPEDLLF